MEEKMDSDRSFSGDSSSTSSSSGSSEGEDDAMEPVRILGQTLELPQELCEDYNIFKEFFSMKTWESLDDKHKEHLKQFLPKFTENAEEETEKTIKMLFNYETFHFTSPLSDFHNNLKQGNYRPDIAKMRKFLKKARAKQQRHKVKSYYAKLLPEVLISRERLLAAAKFAPPGPAPNVSLLPPKASSKNNYKPIYLRAKQRYFEELAAIKSEVGGDDSEDDNYPEGPPETYKKRKHTLGPNAESNISGTLGGSDQNTLTSLQCLKNVLAAHRHRRQYRESHPELNTTGITLEDIKQRVAVVNGAKKLMFGGQKASPLQKLKRGPKKDPIPKLVKQSEGKTAKKIKEDVDSVDIKPMLPNIKIKQEIEESDSESSSFVDPITSPKPMKRLSENIEIKQEIDKYPNLPNSSYDSKLETMIKQEPPDPTLNRNHQPVPIKLEDLDGIDMMALPIEIADDSCDVMQVDSTMEVRAAGDKAGTAASAASVEIDESLAETTHANFLSLVRALFPARDAHRASKQQLHARCAAVIRSPIAPLNTWYNLADDWCAELDSALDFLAGERGTHPDDFVPYLQYMPETQMYQWIGAGRDCDAILGRLCERWLRAASPPRAGARPPPPKYPTAWTVRPPTPADVADFRAQERRRFQSAVRPFTYVQHGYRSVVGPCGRAWAGGGGGAAGGSLLLPERPRHATFAALLRDALARLPNGEGTRHDLLTLLKMSQYVAPCSDHALLAAVSATLERFHTAKRDPVVRYDQRTALWTYLHRNRTEDDWLKTSSGRGRAAKAAAAFAPPALPPPPAPPALPQPPAPPAAAPEPAASGEEGVEASDSDVDVDDSGAAPPGPQLSSAQLLMQATQAQPRAPPPPAPKPKAKLVPTPPQKKSYAPKQTPPKPAKQAALMSQSVKQANLLAQSVKQANLVAQQKANMVQAVKNSVSKQAILVQPPKTAPSTSQPKPAAPPKSVKTIASKPVNIKPPMQSPKLVGSPKQPPQSPKQSLPSPMQPPQSPKQHPPSPKPPPQSPKQVPQVIKPPAQSPKQQTAQITKVAPTAETDNQTPTVPVITPTNISIVKSMPSIVATPHKSPLIKQRPSIKTETIQTPVTTPTTTVIQATTHTIIQPVMNPSLLQSQPKVIPGTRSLLIRPPNVQTTIAPTFATGVAQTPTSSRRGVVRVLSPANPSTGKSLISPRALLQDNPNTKKRNIITTSSVTTIAQSTGNVTNVVSSVATIATTATSTPTRTVQLAGGRTVQLAANQTVQLPGGQAVQLSTGHTLQLSSLQLATHSVRLPSGQTVQLATPQAMQALKASTAALKNSPRIVQTSAIKPQSVQIPVSTVQLAGQTVQIAGQTVQLAGQSVQLTGHTVKLPSGQSVQVASQSVQLPSGQTVQLAGGNVQTVQIAGSNVQLAGQSVQLPGGSQAVQLAGQTVQLAGGQTVQLPGGQTLQLPSGQTVQLSSGQTIQLASGQTVQLANQTKVLPQVIRSQTQGEKAAGQPIVAKLLTSAQGGVVPLESRGRGAVRVVSPAHRLARPLLLTPAKPLHNIILQQSDGTAVRVTSAGGATTSQTIVISNIGAQSVTTPTTTTPVLKLQQVNPLQQIKLAQGIKIQQTSSGNSATPSGVRSVVMDGQQLKLVGGRHVLARILRPALPPQ